MSSDGLTALDGGGGGGGLSFFLCSHPATRPTRRKAVHVLRIARRTLAQLQIACKATHPKLTRLAAFASPRGGPRRYSTVDLWWLEPTRAGRVMLPPRESP